MPWDLALDKDANRYVIVSGEFHEIRAVQTSPNFGAARGALREYRPSLKSILGEHEYAPELLILLECANP